LVRWKRVQDPTSQQWKAFGFAEYADADSLLRTLRVLGQDGQQPKGEKPVGLELKAMDGSETVKALLVKADEKTRQFLDQYDESRPRTIVSSFLSLFLWELILMSFWLGQYVFNE
jgi:RNA-binding protein 25